MKTITEYQPMIFSALLDRHSQRQESRERKVWTGPTLRQVAIALMFVYAMLGLKITSDTGLAAWNWQFWLIFTPLFLLGEQLLRVLARTRLE